MSEVIAEAALQAARVEPQPLTPRHGWVNEAWIGSRHVVRISPGRLRGSLAHEARVLTLVADAAPDVPVAQVVAHGSVRPLDPSAPPESEWLVSRRVPGDTLAAAWPSMDRRKRRRIGRDLGLLLGALHSVRVHGRDLAPRWWVDAHRRSDEIHNAYRPDPTLGPSLVEAARAAAETADDLALLDRCHELLVERMSLFSGDDVVLVHGDVHAHNVMVDGDEITAILDWEGAHVAAPDRELDMFLRYVAAAHAFPERPGARSLVTEGDMLGLIDAVADAYPELFGHAALADRLEVYDVHWHLGSILVTQRLGPPGRDPAWDRLRLALDGRSHVRRLVS